MSGISTDDWKYYELVNPSDTYVFRAPDILIAGAVAFHLSHAYGAAELDPSRDDDELEKTPVLIGWQEWFESHGIDRDWMVDHIREIIVSLRTLWIGGYENYKTLEATLGGITDPAQRVQYLIAHHDQNRSSMNDIYSSAVNTADVLENYADNMETGSDE